MSSTPDFIETYFTEEKIQVLFVIILGVIAIVLASIFLFIIKYSFFKGMAIPLLVIGIIQLTVGSIVYNRSAADIKRVNHFISQEPQKIKTEELPRMEKVMKDFTIYKSIEILLIICGVILWFVFYKSPQTFWKGLALGLIIQASIILALDIVAEKRASSYIHSFKR